MLSSDRKLLKLLLEDKFVCCLCIQRIEEDHFSVFDAVLLEDTDNGKEIKASEILHCVFGLNCLQNLATEKLCRNCFTKLLKCYKFIKLCKENMKNLYNAFTNLENVCKDDCITELELFSSKTMYLTTEKFGGNVYYDKRIVNDCSDALKRFEIVSSSDKIRENSDDCSGECEDLELFNKKTNRHRSKRNHKKDYTGSKIPISEILYNKEDCSLYKCKQCLKTYSSMHNLKRHFIRVHAPKDFCCYKCNKSFGSHAILEEHKLGSHSGKKEICTKCGKKFSSIKSLKLHELSHRLILECSVCSKSFHHTRNYERHVKSKKCEQFPSRNRESIEAKYTCDYCNKKYACKGTLRVHIRVEHSNGYHHICSWCGKKFSCVSKLKAHNVKHTQEKNFVCQICGGFFVTKESLVYHTRIHTGEKPYQCDQCEQRFISASRRAEHIRRYHLEPKLECDVCHTKFKGRSCLLRHKKRHYDPKSRLHYTKMIENE